MNVNPKLVPADTARPEPVREQQHFAILSFVPYRTISLSLSISFHTLSFWSLPSDDRRASVRPLSLQVIFQHFALGQRVMYIPSARIDFLVHVSTNWGRNY